MNTKLNVVSETIMASWSDLSHFLIVFFAILVVFVLVGSRAGVFRGSLPHFLHSNRVCLISDLKWGTTREESLEIPALCGAYHFRRRGGEKWNYL